MLEAIRILKTSGLKMRALFASASGPAKNRACSAPALTSSNISPIPK